MALRRALSPLRGRVAVTRSLAGQWLVPASLVPHVAWRARWTKKQGKRYYGYQHHISTDRPEKLIRCCKGATAHVHDSQVFDELLDPRNRSADVGKSLSNKAMRRTASAPRFEPAWSISSVTKRRWAVSW